MIDFHSHILPNIDDGASSVEMSLQMLAESYRQGVRTVVATPHCYIMREGDIERFLKKREKSYKILCEAIQGCREQLPEIKLGCEVKASEIVSDFNSLRPLCIENTDYILVEMPYTKWNINCYDFLYGLLLKGMKPIMAHIERFMDKKKEFYNLYSLDLLYQVNADAFLSMFMKRQLPELFSNGAVQVIGSDMHSMTHRATHMKKAADAIVKGYGKERLELLMRNAQKILDNKPVERDFFELMSFWEKLKL